MKNKKQPDQSGHYSVLNDFIKISSLVVLLTIVSLILFVYQEYRIINQSIYNSLQKESVRAVEMIKNSFAHIEYIMSNVASEIKDRNGNIKYIGNAIEELNRQDFLKSWNYIKYSIYWTEKNGIIVASSDKNKIRTMHPVFDNKKKT